MSELFYLDPSPNNTPAVFLLHGLGTEAGSWVYQIRALQMAGFRPVAPDLPGFGQSKYTGKKWSITETAGEICALADRLGIERFHLAGISMGGTIALQTAIAHPERVSSLILINTFATLRPKRLSDLYYLIRRYFRARLMGAGAQAELTASRVFPRPGQEKLRRELVQHIRQTDPEVYKTAMRELGLFDNRKRLRDIHIPTLVISGENDTTVPLENQRDLVTGIPGSRYVLIPDAGHGVIIDQPDSVNEKLVEFIQQQLIRDPAILG